MNEMKHIVITGASSGIGKTTAKLLLDAGHRVSLLSRSIERLSDEFDSPNASLVQCDVKDYNSVQKAIDQAFNAQGTIDVLINNAGLGVFDKFAEGKIEEWHNMVDTNVKGVLNCLHVALPHLRASKGHIINIASVAAHHVFPNSGVYCSTKWAVAAISESIRLELASEVRVTTISPGAVNTAFIDQTSNQDLLKDYKGYFADGLDPSIIAENILHAINTSDTAVISEIIVRPNRQNK
jgi:NADP-dependent 3-hydroxy acid dehydrogenase YdfG